MKIQFGNALTFNLSNEAFDAADFRVGEYEYGKMGYDFKHGIHLFGILIIN